MRVLREQQYHISNLKAKINEKKKELDQAHQYSMIREKEDELKNLKRILKDLMNEREVVLGLRKDQEKTLHNLQDSETHENRRKELLEELNEIKRENKVLMEKKGELEKQLNKNHSKLVNGKLYIRELEKKIEDHKKKYDGTDLKNITEEDIENLKEKMMILEQEKRERTLMNEEDLRNVEKMKAELRRENQRLEKILREKDKEMRLNSLKMKELKRLQRLRMNRPVKGRIGLKKAVSTLKTSTKSTKSTR
jgi:hypothetical protein